MRNTKIIVALLALCVGVSSFCVFSFYQKEKYEAKAWKILGMDISLPDISLPDIDLPSPSEIVDELVWKIYKLYMTWVGNGSSASSELYTDLINKFMQMAIATPRYRFNLADARVAYTSRFNWGMTDCRKIYFGGSSGRALVDNVKNSRALTRGQVYWLAHELTHAEQCTRWGGRKYYALKWFGQVYKQISGVLTSGRFADIVNVVYNAQNLTDLDDNISMEREATTRADAVLREFDRMRYPYAR